VILYHGSLVRRKRFTWRWVTGKSEENNFIRPAESLRQTNRLFRAGNGVGPQRGLDGNIDYLGVRDLKALSRQLGCDLGIIPHRNIFTENQYANADL